METCLSCNAYIYRPGLLIVVKRAYYPGAEMFSVLYVDDEPDLLEICKIYLEESGQFVVDTVTSASSALDMIDKKRYHAIIADYQMPGMNGIDFLRAVRGSGNQIPFILFTGKGREEVVIQALNEGADFYIQKGGDPAAQFAELQHKVKKAVEQRQSERALQESESYLNRIVTLAPVGIGVSIGRVIQSANDRFSQITGYTPEEMIGHSARMLYPDEEEFDRVGRDLFETMHARGTIETRWRRKDGNIVDALFSVTPVDPSDMSRGVVFIALDITGLKQTEDALQKSEKKARTIFDQASDIMILHDRTGHIVDVNEKACNILGYSREELLGMSVTDFDPDAIATGKSSFWDEVARGKAIRFESCNRRKDGVTFPVEVTIGPIEIDNEVFILGAVRDITDRKTAEEALWESEERYRTIFETCAEGVLIVDFNTRKLLYANPAITTILGYTEEELTSMRIEDIHPEDALPDVLREFSGLTDGRSLRVTEIPVLTKDKTIRYVNINSAKIILGGMTCFVGLFTDVTEQKEARETLKDSEEQYRLLFEHMEEGMALHEIVFDTGQHPSDYRILAVNAAYQKHVGIDPASVLGKTSRDAYHTLDPPYFDVYLRVAQSGQPEVFETYFPPLNRNFEISVYSPKKNQFVTIFTDITRRKNAEMQLQESEDLFRTLFESANDAIFLHELTPEGKPDRYIKVNSTACRRLGYTPDEMLRMTPSDIVATHYRDKMENIARELRESGYITFETVHRRNDGSEFPVEISTRTFEWNGRMVALSVARDITERKMAGNALVLANTKLNLLASVTRHDILNQITSLKGSPRNRGKIA